MDYFYNKDSIASNEYYELPIKNSYSNREKQRKKIKKNAFLISAMQIFLLIFILSLLTVKINTLTLKKQFMLNNLRLEIDQIKTENNNYEASYLKLTTYEKILDAATNKLGMVRPTKENYINVDMSKKFFD